MVPLWLIWAVLSTLQCGSGLLCYHCHQTSGDCRSGVRTLDVINCTANECFILKYETEKPGVTVLATFRGCYSRSEQEIMETVITEKHVVRKINFHRCNATLCNRSSSIDKSSLYLICYCVIIIYFKIK